MASFFQNTWTEALEVTIAKKDRADSGTSRVQKLQWLLPKSKAQKKVSKKLFIAAETSRSVGTE
jgi:hypothetical protein